MSQELSTTSYALLGLLAFDAETSEHGLTGYELKQRADFTLRFYWTSPATSQIYSELGRLARTDLVETVAARQGRRTTRRYRLTSLGRKALQTWLGDSTPAFPTLKHPIALRLLMGDLMSDGDVVSMLETYREDLAERSGELEAIRASLGDAEATRFPALVADWGIAYYASERRIVGQLLAQLDQQVSG